MLNNINKTDLFYDYYAQWITVYKEGIDVDGVLPVVIVPNSPSLRCSQE